MRDSNHFLELIRSAGLCLLDPLLALARPAGSAAEGKKSLLIVRLDLIGDFVLWLDAARALREFFPAEAYAITLAGNDVWTSLAEETGLFDTVLPVDRKRLFKNVRYRRHVLRTIRRAEFDVVLNPAFSREFLLGDAIVRASGAPVRIGFDGDFANIRPWERAVSDRWYSRLIAATAGEQMELERNAEFIRGIGWPDFRAGLPELPAVPPPPDLPAKSYFVVAPSASYAAKRWPEEFFARLIGRIIAESGWECVLCGGPGEEGLGESIRNLAGLPVEDRIGRTSLREMVGMIAGARLVVTNDSAAVHIAAAVATAVVVITGGGQPGRFLPYRLEQETVRPLPVVVRNVLPCYGCNWKCEKTGTIHRTAPCIESVSVETVWQAVRPLLTDQVAGT